MKSGGSDKKVRTEEGTINVGEIAIAGTDVL
jgi:hypothetical protein